MKTNIECLQYDVTSFSHHHAIADHSFELQLSLAPTGMLLEKARYYVPRSCSGVYSTVSDPMRNNFHPIITLEVQLGLVNEQLGL
jgi:hypothetical protein